MTHWEERLFSLHEGSLFNMIRNYIINIETPYNKQDLIRKLSNWLEREENYSAILENISTEERKILSVIYYLKGVPQDQLPLQWDKRIRENLEERLLIFPQNDSYEITPSLEPKLLDSGIISFSLFLEWEESTSSTEPLFYPDDRLLMGFLTWFSEERAFYLNDGTPRRRFIEELQDKFPYPTHWEDSFFCELVELFVKAGLLQKKERNIVQGPLKRIREFEALDQESRILFLSTLNAPTSSQSHIIDLIHSLKNEVPPGSTISLNGWNRLLYLVIPHPTKKECVRWSELPQRLSLLGICTYAQDRVGFNPPLEKSEEVPHSLLVQPNGDIDAPPHTPFSSALALCCYLERGETYYHFRMTRETFEQGLRVGIGAQDLIDDLVRLSGHTLPENLITTIGEWEKQLLSLRVVEGVLLNVKGYPLAIFEKSPDLAPHIKERISSNWFLMHGESETQWRALLSHVDLNPFQELERDLKQDHLPLPVKEPVSLPPISKSHVKINLDREKNQEVLLVKLKGLELREEWEKELSQRIERGVILFPAQITPDLLRQEACKAGGLDFNSKLRLINGSLDSGNSFLEIKIAQKGSIVSIQIDPLEMHNSREESILLYRNLSDAEECEIAVRKILEVIRFHKTLLS